MSDSQEELQQRIAAYIDGELSPAEAARLEVYLANTDPALADQVVGMLADKVQVRAMSRPRAPADLAGHILEQIERSSLLREDISHHRAWWQSRAAIAAGLAIVLGGFTYFVASTVVRPRPISPLANSGDQPAPSGMAKSNAGHNGEAIKGGIAADNTQDQTVAMNGDQNIAGQALAQTVPGPLVMPDRQLVSNAQPRTPNQDLLSPPGGADTTGQGPAAAPTAAVRGAGGGRGGRGGGGGGGGAGGGGFAGAGGGAAGGGGGFGGGGGGGGGGRGAVGRGGGRAGAAGGAAAPAVAMAPTQSAENAPALADTTQRAIAAINLITRANSNTPIVISLRAANEQDFARLANELAAFSGTNARARLNDEQRIVQLAQTPLANVAEQVDPRAGVRQQNVTVQNSAINGSRDVNLDQGNTKAVSGTLTLSNGTASNSAIVTNSTANNFDNTVRTNVPNNSISNGNLTLNNAGANGWNTNQLYNDQNIGNINNRASQQQFVGQTASQGGPYRVALRADQMKELATTFRVTVLARGNDVYQFGSIGDKAPATADAAVRRELLVKFGLDAPNAKAAVAQAAPAAPATPPAAANANANAKDDAGPLVDCVITMDPPVAPAAAPGAPSATPQVGQ